ncbi:MAG: AAA family ATPase [Candidatus Flexifilum sp.]|jgi:predicted ATPase
MLTRLKVSGFKNLVDIDVRFGPFTCIVGANGVGKSNLFDAIRFLSMTADHTLVEAAQSIRDEAGRSGDLRDIFHRVGDRITGHITLEAEMIIPASGEDRLGQPASATTTFLRYSLELAYRPDNATTPIEIVREELRPGSNKRDFKKHLLFPHRDEWRESLWMGERRNSIPFISTGRSGDGDTLIRQHQEGVQGRTYDRTARKLSRTTLSAITAAESATAVLAQQELRSWRLLQLEPSALRRSDDFNTRPPIEPNGAHMPITLYRLAHAPGIDAAAVYAEISSDLFELLDEFKSVWVDQDERRETYTLMVTDKNGTSYPARALSDGTLRFLALTIMSRDPGLTGVLCLEEPENGIHPQRIPLILDLMRRIAVDPNYPVDDTNPLRQVIVNTHSPWVVQLARPDELVGVYLSEAIDDTGERYRRAVFRGLAQTWRSRELDAAGERPLELHHLLGYLNAPSQRREADRRDVSTNGHETVVEYLSQQMPLPFRD